MDSLISGGPAASVSDDELMTRLAPIIARWQEHNARDLVLRHETGMLLNEFLGDPGKRTERGRETVRKVAEQLQIDESDISRMRWFAFHFASVAVLLQKHPTVTTWSAVKDLLPTLTPAAKKGQSTATVAQEPANQGNPLVMKRLLRHITGLSLELQQFHEDLSDEQKAALRQQFEALAKAVEDCLQIRVSIDEPKVQSPGKGRKRATAKR